VRDRCGGWTHPEFFVPAEGNEYPLPGEFEAWLSEHALQSANTWMENDVPGWLVMTFWKIDNCSRWQPSGPAGDGWFVGSLYDTDDSPVCVCLHSKMQVKDE